MKTVKAVVLVVLAAVAVLAFFSLKFFFSNDVWIVSQGEASNENLAKLGVPANAAKFYLFSYVFFVRPKPRSWDIDGVRITSEEKPGEAIQRILAGQKIVIEGRMFEGYDERNTAIGALGGEIAAGLVRSGKNSSLFGSINGTPSINCVPETNNCSNASIVLEIGECNCMKLGSRIEVIGTREFLQENRVKIAAIIRAGLQANATPVLQSS